MIDSGNPDLIRDYERLATEIDGVKCVVLGDVRELVQNELVRIANDLHSRADAMRVIANELADRASDT